MKTSRVIILLLVAITASTLLFYNKMSKENDSIDKMGRALDGVRSYVKPGSKIGFSGEQVYPELFAWSKFVLAPAILYESDTADTLLYVKYNADTLKQNRHIIWSASDSQYYYTLTVK